MDERGTANVCGLLGTIDLPYGSESLDLIRHRGPDARGELMLEIAGRRFQLGHQRLAIVDLSEAGAQPMLSHSGRTLIGYNGEVYNHGELRRHLSCGAFRSHSDTETVLEALEAKGVGALAEFNGIFALAFVDLRAATLYLARDPFGVKPLYYWTDGRRAVFGSELTPIAQLVGAEVQADRIPELLRLRYLPAPDTLLKNVHKVRPGHVVEFRLDAGVLEAREYPYVRPRRTPASLSFEEAVTRYGELLSAAVGRQLMADVEIGVLLSGGVDSAIVAAIAARQSGRVIKAFTVGFLDGGNENEIDDAAETAALLGLEHHVAHIGAADFFEAFRTTVLAVEEPLATTSMIPMNFLAAMVAKQVKVVMAGQGADEPLGGYTRYQGMLVGDRLGPMMSRRLGRFAHLAVPFGPTITRGLKSFACRPGVPRLAESYTVFEAEQVLRLVGLRDKYGEERIAYVYNWLDCGSRDGDTRAMMAVDLRMNLADDLLLYTDKVTMHHSIECRVPFLDLELVAFMENLPTDYLLRFSEKKRVHKRAAEQLLPKTIVHRPKKVFASPTKAWLRNSSVVRECLTTSNTKFAKFFDVEEVEKVVQRHDARGDQERQIFLLLGLYHWLERFA
jgi:asparagine synthase (glutamine-hydrolysing)